jgi:alkaline phosphatase D
MGNDIDENETGRTDESMLLKRRTVLRGGGALAALAIVGAPRFARAEHWHKLQWPYTMGVASGDPWPDSVILWTRLAPSPQDPGGGMPARAEPVWWQVARDEQFRDIVRWGLTWARPEHGHSVHVEADGLRPRRTYFYRFWAGGHFSPVGRTRTAPGYGDDPRELKFAFASCQHFETGYYTAYEHMAREDLDFVAFLGDYMYENPPNPRVRSHTGVAEPLTVDDYRARYANYRSDEHLQRAHALFPWIMTFDDHEVDNDWSADVPQDPELQTRDAFLARRAAAFQAYYECMPLRRFSKPNGPDIQVYRRLTFGKLMEVNVLDTRQFRSVTAPCGYGTGPNCDAVLDPTRTMLGEGQEQWLFRGLKRSHARWNVLAQQVPFAYLDVGPEGEERTRHDKWDGYPTARQRVSEFLHEEQVNNPVVITGDVHSAWMQVAHLNPYDPESDAVATEFVGTSISSGGDGADQSASAPAIMAKNPHLLFQSARRGYVSCTITKDLWRGEFRTLPYVSTPGAAIATAASFVVEEGHPTPHRE